MSTLPGGWLAPRPPVTRVAMGGLAFLVAALFAFVWAGMGVLVSITTPETAQIILRRALTEPTQVALAEAVQTQNQSPVAVNHDLLNFSVDRSQAADINLPKELAGRRAVELYTGGFPKDPGIERTPTELPRGVLKMMTADRHSRLKTARIAALIGAATAFLMCAVIALGASRFLLPGAAAFLGYLLLQYHIRLLNFWVERNERGALLYRGQVRIASYEPGRDLLFVAITLIVAGVVFRGLRGSFKAAFGSRANPAPAAEGEGTPA